jgi:hypothetical protein
LFSVSALQGESISSIIFNDKYIYIPLDFSGGLFALNINNLQEGLKIKNLHRQRILEIIDFTGEEDELYWLNDNLIQGVHLSTGLLRAAAMSHEKKQIMDQIMNLSASRHFHTYSGGISLVHDFNFAKNNSITFTYGSFLMPAVTKHQILKIKHSQFSSITSSTNFSRGPHPRNPTCSLD